MWSKRLLSILLNIATNANFTARPLADLDLPLKTTVSLTSVLLLTLCI
jgi:hypothetical protein